MQALEIFPLDQVLARYAWRIAAVGDQAPLIMAMALNKEGAKGRSDVHRALRTQTGLKLSAITPAITTIKASPRRLVFTLEGKGDFVPLKAFSPREVRGGVKHKSPRDPSPYPGAFLRVGGWVYNAKKRNVVFRMGARKTTGAFGGHVMMNPSGRWGGKTIKVMSKVSIPREMIVDQSRAAFERVGPRVVIETGRLLYGVMEGKITPKSKAKSV